MVCQLDHKNNCNPMDVAVDIKKKKKAKQNKIIRPE
jgi:hypothetical protein